MTTQTDTETAALAEIIRAGTNITPIPNGNNSIPAVLCPAGMSVADLEHLLPNPTRVRAKYKTDDLDDLIRYVQEHATTEDDPHIYLDAPAAPATAFTGTATAVAVLDHGNRDHPLWRDHRATWTPTLHPALEALGALVNRPVGQDALLDYLDAWGYLMGFARPDGTAVPFPQARAAISAMNIETLKSLRGEVGDFQRQKGSLETISIQPSRPTAWRLTCDPWLGLPQRDIDIRLSPTDAGGLAVKLTVLRWPLLVLDLQRDVRRVLLEAFDYGTEPDAPPLRVTVLRGKYS